MKFGIIVFPGSNCDHDCYHVVTRILNQEAVFLWHKDVAVGDVDCLILPGGFSYGDYLRSGAMAARSPIMNAVRKFADRGGCVLGICNGFQILQEVGLLPGVMMRNKTLKFICRDVFVKVENADTPFTSTLRRGQTLRIPIAHMDGNFYAEPRVMSELVDKGLVLLRYSTEDGTVEPGVNPNGSMEAIAAVINERGNVCGMMPHPERCSEGILGNQDGRAVFESVINTVNRKR